MAISVTCHCGKSLNVPETLAGKKGKCPRCQSIIAIPSTIPEVEEETYSLGAVFEPQEKSSPLIFDTPQHREQCQKCGAFIEEGDVLCDACAGKTAKKGAKVAAKNMEAQGVDPNGQPGQRHAMQLARIILVPLYLLFSPILMLIAMCMPRDGVESKAKRDDSDEDES